MPCSRTQHGLTRVGLEPPTSGSGVQGINHQACDHTPLMLQESVHYICLSYEWGAWWPSGRASNSGAKGLRGLIPTSAVLPP